MAVASAVQGYRLILERSVHEKAEGLDSCYQSSHVCHCCTELDTVIAHQDKFVLNQYENGACFSLGCMLSPEGSVPGAPTTQCTPVVMYHAAMLSERMQRFSVIECVSDNAVSRVSGSFWGHVYSDV